MTENAEPRVAGDVTLKDLIVFGPLTVGLTPQPEGIAPRLPFVEPKAILEDREPNLLSALRWEYGLAPTLRGRDAELAAILAWAEGGGNTVSAQLITGPGGAGKTRLAAEVARALRERGWSAGFLPRDARTGQEIDASGRGGGGLLLIIDYPEERPDVVEGLFKHIADIVNPPLPIRFLLISRRSFEDWRRQTDLLGGRFGRQELATPGPLAPGDARGVLEETAENFARLTGKAVPPLAAAEVWLAGDSTRRLALFAMAAGVHSVLAGRGDFSLGAPELMREVARREHQRVRRISTAIGLGEYGLERLLGLAPMNAGGLNAERVTRLGELDIAPGIAGQALLDALAPIPWWKPSSFGGRLVRLEPDRPAAAFLELVLLANPQPRLPDWLYVASAGTGREFGPVLSRLAWDLTELSADGRGAAPLEQAVLAMIDAAPQRAADFREVGFDQGTAFSASFAVRVLKQVLGAEGDPEKRPALLKNLANFLSHLGQREEALAAAAEAVDLYRRLVAAHPDTFAYELAGSLITLAFRLSERGEREEARTAATEATKLFRRLAADHPEAFASELAMSLHTLADSLSALGRREDALAAAADAVGLYRGLTAARSEAFTGDLAMSLRSLASCLSDLGRREDALAAAADAVGLYRGLTAARPEAFTPDLALSIDNLANRLSALGRFEEALAAATEAVELFRRLAAVRLEAYMPHLGRSLNNLGTPLSALGRREDALAAVEEAVDLYRQLAVASPEAFTPDLATFLGNLANRLSDLGRRNEAFAAAEEAVTLLSTFFLASPPAYGDWMQMVIQAYLVACASLGGEPAGALLAPIVPALERLKNGRHGAGPAEK